MSFDVHWDINKHREDHESDDHWELRRAFMEKWKNDYPEDRLVCLAKVFANIEFMGCRYPVEVMQEVARLSHDVAKSYRQSKQSKLQRTFVSASTAAEDRAKGVKRIGGQLDEEPVKKKIQFVPSGHKVEEVVINSDSDTEQTNTQTSTPAEMQIKTDENPKDTDSRKPLDVNLNEYMDELSRIRCMNVRSFRENMFHTIYGRMVLLIRPWASKLWNIQASCQACGIPVNMSYEHGNFTFSINNKILETVSGYTKMEAKSIVEGKIWEMLCNTTILLLVKEQWIAHNDTKISVSDVSGKRVRDDAFGTPVENSVATKMMKLMGWKGGGLGADSQGIAEPIKPNLQMVNRAGLGSTEADIHALRRAGHDLMRRYIASDTLDLDLVFSSEFSKEERAALHQCAQKAGLVSRSYGGGVDRFLVVKKKLDPFSLVRAVIEKGGSTPKYQVFIPEGLRSNGR